jgi:uncharacterized protein (TIGR00369 family)
MHTETRARSEASPLGRARTFEWLDPIDAARRGAGMTGLAHLMAIADGRIGQPPIGEALGFRLTEVERGRAVFRCVPAEHHYNLIGSVHGGLAAALIDSATGCAVMSTLPAGDAWTTVSLRVDYLSAIDVSVEALICEGRTVRVGRRTAIADAELKDPAGRVYARGSTTCLVMRA